MSSNVNWLLGLPDFQRIAPFRTLSEHPLGFIDIGARGGVHPLLEPLAGATAVLGFDPDVEECRAVEAAHARQPVWRHLEMVPAAVAEQTGPVTFHLTRAPVNHSLRPVNPAFPQRYIIPGLDSMGTVDVPGITLDDALFGSRADNPFWGEIIKSDAQGCDADLLGRAQRTLRERTVAIVVETIFLEAYAGQKRFSETELLLREQGFSFYGFLSLNYRSRRLIDKRRVVGRERLFYADAVFFRDPLPAGGQGGITERQTHVLFCAALLFGYYDFALDLALSGWAGGNVAEEQAIRSVIEALSQPQADQIRAALRNLVSDIDADPADTLVRIGKFIDQQRGFATYDDVILSQSLR